MKITRDVVSDLMPAYLSGEATADTRALVEELSATDPEISRLVESARQEGRDTMVPHAVALPPDLERETILRTRAELRRRSRTFGLALLFTLLPLSIGGHSGAVTFFMLRDEPASMLLWLGAAYLWFDYVRLGRRLRIGG